MTGPARLANQQSVDPAPDAAQAAASPFETFTTSAVTPKPCELPCPKCGSQDISRAYRARGATWRTSDSDGYVSRFAGCYRAYTMSANREHIEHHCRTCQHDWQAPPLPKPRKAKGKQRG